MRCDYLQSWLYHKKGETFRSLTISVIVKGAVTFFIIAVDFVLALENLLAILESEHTYGSSMFKQSFELKDR